jgi:hypothetical protein
MTMEEDVVAAIQVTIISKAGTAVVDVTTAVPIEVTAEIIMEMEISMVTPDRLARV